MTEQVVNTDAVASEIYSLMTGAASNIQQAAEKLVACIDAGDVSIKDALRSMGVSRNTLDDLERFGRRQIDPRLMMNESRTVRAVKLLPLSSQVEIIENGVEVLEPNGYEPRRIPLDDLTSQQVEQVVNVNRVRSLAEQRTWLEAEKARQAPKVVRADYEIARNRVKLIRPGWYDADSLISWAKQAKARARRVSKPE